MDAAARGVVRRAGEGGAHVGVTEGPRIFVTINVDVILR